jgi:hypothetical protein
MSALATMCAAQACRVAAEAGRRCEAGARRPVMGDARVCSTVQASTGRVAVGGAVAQRLDEQQAELRRARELGRAAEAAVPRVEALFERGRACVYRFCGAARAQLQLVAWRRVTALLRCLHNATWKYAVHVCMHASSAAVRDSHCAEQ